MIYRLSKSSYFTNLIVKSDTIEHPVVGESLKYKMENSNLIIKKDGKFIKPQLKKDLAEYSIKLPPSLVDEFNIKDIPSKEVFYLVKLEDFRRFDINNSYTIDFNNID